MKYLIFGLSLLLTTMDDAQDPIPQLTWKNYKAKVASKPNVSAITSCAFAAESNERGGLKFPIRIICAVFEDRSWVDTSVFRLSPSAIQQLLNHEQNHFNLAVIYAKRLQQIVADKLLFENEYNALHDSVWKAYKFQDSLIYDVDTKLGKDLKQQLLWNNVFSHELDNLKDVKITIQIR